MWKIKELKNNHNYNEIPEADYFKCAHLKTLKI